MEVGGLTGLVTNVEFIHGSSTIEFIITGFIWMVHW
jgi:hypothetical protein